jgi:plasmid stability protein
MPEQECTDIKLVRVGLNLPEEVRDELKIAAIREKKTMEQLAAEIFRSVLFKAA